MLLKDRQLYTLINIAVLSISIAMVLILSIYVNFESSYDTFHNSEQVYRAESRLSEGGSVTDSWATTTYGHATAIAQKVPGVEAFVRLTAQDREQVVSYEQKAYTELNYCYTEPSFFDVFNFPIIDGDRESPLDRPNCVVVSKTAAIRYFGEESPLGKRLSFRTATGEQYFEVTAIMDDMPQNSNLKYDFLLSYNTIPKERQNIWYIHGVYTYFKLKNQVLATDIESGFAAISNDYRTKALSHKEWGIELVPLLDIHLNPQKPYEKQIKGNRDILFVLLLMAIALMVISWVNYLNLTIARSMGRAREVLLRRVYGARSGSIFLQMAVEAMVVHIVAASLALLLFYLSLGPLSTIMGFRLEFSWFGFAVLMSIVVIGTFIVTITPSIMLVKLPLTRIMRTNLATSRGANFIRQSLVALQFTCSFVLICSTLTIIAQLSSMQSQELGIRTQRTLVVKYPAYMTDMQRRSETFRSEVLTIGGIENVTNSGAVPGIEVANYFSVRQFGANSYDAKLMQMLAVDRNFIDAYQINLAAGRGFSPSSKEDVGKVVINEKCAKLLGFSSPEQAVGKLVVVEVLREPMEVLGVVEDYRQQAFSHDIKPIVMINRAKMSMISTPFISVQFNQGVDIEGVIAGVEASFKRCFPTAPFDYFLLEDFYDSQYKSERNFWSMLSIAALIALLSGAVGLWVMSHFSISARGPQINIRKIYGASAPSLVVLLTKELLIVTLIATVAGAYLTYSLMEQWLSGYSESVGVSWVLFVICSLLLFVIGFLTIAQQIYKAIKSKPVIR